MLAKERTSQLRTICRSPALPAAVERSGTSCLLGGSASLVIARRQHEPAFAWLDLDHALLLEQLRSLPGRPHGPAVLGCEIPLIGQHRARLEVANRCSFREMICDLLVGRRAESTGVADAQSTVTVGPVDMSRGG